MAGIAYAFLAISSVILVSFVTLTASESAKGPLPFVLVYGFGSRCGGPNVKQTLDRLERYSGAKGICMEIGSLGATSSRFTDMWSQVNEVCRKISANPRLARGFNIVGLSQGALVARAVIQTCDTMPRVHNFVSVGGPQAGVASIPWSSYVNMDLFLGVVNAGLSAAMYTRRMQKAVAPAGYFKIPTALGRYLRGCDFLPVINNELPEVNRVFVDRLKKLNRMVLIKFTEDMVVYPRESSHFRFYSHNSYSHIPELHRTDSYQRDTLGLRHLKETGRLEIVDLPGGHLDITEEAARNSIAPHLTATAADIRKEAHEEASNDTLYHYSTADAPVSQFVSPYHSYARREHRHKRQHEGHVQQKQKYSAGQRRRQEQRGWYNALPRISLPRIPAAVVSLLLMFSLWISTATATAGSLPLASLLHAVPSSKVQQETGGKREYAMACDVRAVQHEMDEDVLVGTDPDARGGRQGQRGGVGAEQWVSSRGLQFPRCSDRQQGRRPQLLHSLQLPAAPSLFQSAHSKPQATAERLSLALPPTQWRGALRLHMSANGRVASAAMSVPLTTVRAFL